LNASKKADENQPFIPKTPNATLVVSQKQSQNDRIMKISSCKKGESNDHQQETLKTMLIAFDAKIKIL